jgi:hypothetical protein
VLDPITQDEGAAHDTTDRLVLAATVMALDHVPAGPVVVVVVVVVLLPLVVVVGPALDEPWLHPAARNESAAAASAAVIGPARLT